jgi:RNA polymerase sigma-70 factor (ECF subfamily)
MDAGFTLSLARIRERTAAVNLEQSRIGSSRDLSDETLLERCRTGDHAAFTALVDRYKDRVYWLVRRMVGETDAEDLTQEVFIRVYEAVPGFRGRSSFKTWIYRIAHNLCLSELRKRGVRAGSVSLEEEGEEGVHRMLPPGRPGLPREIERRDISGLVRRLIEKLPVPYRTALTMYYLQQLKYEEIADITGTPLGTVKTHIRRARMRLRDLVLKESGLQDLSGLEGSGGGER